MTSMSEVSRYLQTDGNAGGVNAVNKQLRAALERENNIREKADAVIDQINAMRSGK